MSLQAVFAIKFPSLLQFEKSSHDPQFVSNLTTLFGVQTIPSDTQMRAIIDDVSHSHLTPLFKHFFKIVQRGKKLSQYKFMRRDGQHFYLVPVDGTQYFSSHKVNCSKCMVKTHRDDTQTFYHQMLAAVVAHPEVAPVLPIAVEPIFKHDGAKKNDCEFSAFKRLAGQLREDHPKLPMIICGDALYAKGALVKILNQHGMSYILNVKPKGNKVLFHTTQVAERRGWMNHHEVTESVGIDLKKKRTHTFNYINGMAIDNESSLEIKVNFLDYRERTEWVDGKGRKKIEEKHFTWVTDLHLDKKTVFKVMRGARCRWKIESVPQKHIRKEVMQFSA